MKTMEIHVTSYTINIFYALKKKSSNKFKIFLAAAKKNEENIHLSIIENIIFLFLLDRKKFV
jgi:hypothetical protein